VSVRRVLEAAKNDSFDGAETKVRQSLHSAISLCHFSIPVQLGADTKNIRQDGLYLLVPPFALAFCAMLLYRGCDAA
jgi:hypothetical protein